ncbi:MAG: peptidylprolyl isomerase [Erythrobacter sp.]
MNWPAWAREPIVHFLIAGFALFVALTWNSSGIDPSSRVISIGGAEKAQIALQFERTMGRAPTDAELDVSIERFVREEVLYREALRLGLDKDDTVVRRRLVTKMDLSASAAAEAAEPDDATLKAFYDANKARYAAAGKVSFDQLYFADQAQAQYALSSLGKQPDWQGAGQAISLPATLKTVSQREVATRFGEGFADALWALKAGNEWQGPVLSGFGWHLVRLRGREAGDAPAFEQARKQVENDWRSEQISTRKARAYAILREEYRVEIEQ